MIELGIIYFCWPLIMENIMGIFIVLFCIAILFACFAALYETYTGKSLVDIVWDWFVPSTKGHKH